MDGYTAALAEYRPDDVVLAIKETIKVCKFFPKPAEIIEIAKTISTKRRMICGQDDPGELSEHDRAEVTELLAGFKKQTKWD